MDRLRSELQRDRKCAQKADSRPKRSASLLDIGSNIIENGRNLDLKCYPCQKSSLFITKEVSKDQNCWTFTYFQTLEKNFPGWTIFQLTLNQWKLKVWLILANALVTVAETTTSKLKVDFNSWRIVTVTEKQLRICRICFVTVFQLQIQLVT